MIDSINSIDELIQYTSVKEQSGDYLVQQNFENNFTSDILNEISNIIENKYSRIITIVIITLVSILISTVLFTCIKIKTCICKNQRKKQNINKTDNIELAIIRRKSSEHLKIDEIEKNTRNNDTKNNVVIMVDTDIKNSQTSLKSF